MHHLTAFTLVSLTISVAALVLPRTAPPASWSPALEVPTFLPLLIYYPLNLIYQQYDTYHTRYLALDCPSKHNSSFFDQCCHPLLVGLLLAYKLIIIIELYTIRPTSPSTLVLLSVIPPLRTTPAKVMMTQTPPRCLPPRPLSRPHQQAPQNLLHPTRRPLLLRPPPLRLFQHLRALARILSAAECAFSIFILIVHSMTVLQVQPFSIRVAMRGLVALYTATVISLLPSVSMDFIPTTNKANHNQVDTARYKNGAFCGKQVYIVNTQNQKVHFLCF